EAQRNDGGSVWFPTTVLGPPGTARGARFFARPGAPRHSKLPDRVQEQYRRDRDQQTSDWQAERVGKEAKWPSGVERRSREKRSQKDERRANDGGGGAGRWGVTPRVGRSGHVGRT